jgi:hypothetical protein
MTLDEAFDGLVATLHCPCELEIVERWERDFPYKPQPIKK